MALTKITSRILDSSGVTILGTIATGVWQGTPIADDHIASAATWNTASTDRLKWDGGATGLTASTGRTSLGLVIGTDVLAQRTFNDTNWDNAYTYSQVGHLPLAGGTLTGALVGTSATFSELVTGQAGIHQTNASSLVASNNFGTYNGGATNMNFNYPASGSVTFENDSPRLTILSTGMLISQMSSTTGAIRLGGENGAGNSRIFIQSAGDFSYIDSYGGGAYQKLAIIASTLTLNSAGGNTIMLGNGSLKIPTGTTGERPSTPSSGMIRFNSTLGKIEWYDSISSIWQSIYPPTFIIQYLVVAGGGSGGVWTEQTVGYSNGNQGSNSVFSSITSIGGGGGRAYAQGTQRTTGGSGGGGSGGNSDRTPGVGTSNQGYNGGNGYNDNRAGGGGGAGAVGANATSTAHGAGGIGVSSSISGTATYYAGGGGGAGAYNTPSGGAGGNGGGGAGAAPGSGPGTNGSANTGGGGGAADAYWGQSHGGGGAGGFRTNDGASGGGASSESTLSVSLGTTHTITVGAGGSGVGTSGTGGISNKNTKSGAGGSGIVILKLPNIYTALFSSGLTTSLNTSVAGFHIYSVTAGTGTVTFT